MTIGERIKELRRKYGMTQDELAEKIQTTKQTIFKYENNIITNIPAKRVNAIAEVFNVSPAYIMGWDSDDRPLPSNILPLPKTRKVPLLGNIACGEPILATENIDSYIEAPEDVECDFSLRCKGDSMIGARIMDGDIVYIREQPEVENGEIAAVLIDNMETEATLKRVYISDNQIMLVPENRAYQPITFVGEEMNRVRILGKAVAFFSLIQ